jgi:hypothetical protein
MSPSAELRLAARCLEGSEAHVTTPREFSNFVAQIPNLSRRARES